VICGHIHVPAIREIDGIAYYNCGDWVEHCTALVEHLDGTMELASYDSVCVPVAGGRPRLDDGPARAFPELAALGPHAAFGARR
jgi:hypothetical protein